MAIYDKLNDEQRKAVEETEGYVRVVAGAGSGKTRVLTSRYVYIAEVLGISTENILSVTFTNKAAREMKRRIKNYMPEEEGGWILTFHGACHRMLKEDIHRLSYPENFMIMDEDDQSKLLSKIYAENGFNAKDYTFKTCLDAIGNFKCREDYVPFLTNADFDENSLNFSAESRLKIIIKEYLKEQRKNFYLDFDDLLFFVLHLLQTDKEFCEKWQDKFEYIQVDEFQDVSAPEFSFVDILSEKHKNLFIVGDPDQTIYSWRGARVEFFLNFETHFGKAKTIILDKNYRSTPQILNAANSLIRHNKNRIAKNLTAVSGNGATVKFHHAKSVADESKWITENIIRLKNGGVNLNDIAVLYRGNYMTRALEETFIEKGIKYKIYNGVEFYRRQEIKDALAYLRLAVFGDDLSFLRTVNNPHRGIGKKRMDIIKKFAAVNNVTMFNALKAVSGDPAFNSTGAAVFLSAVDKARSFIGKKSVLDILDYLLKNSGYEEALMLDGDRERINNVNELKNSVKNFVDSAGEEVTAEEYLNMTSLMTNADTSDANDSVKLMTIHTAKGLEFPYVFVCCLNEGKFPSRKIKNIDDMEEERRVAYVAVTRAEKELYLSDAEGYDPQSSGEMYVSRFIFDIGTDVLEISGELSSEHLKKSAQFIGDGAEDKSAKIQIDLKVGDRVAHRVFGQGRIIEIADSTIKITFDSGVTRSFSVSFAGNFIKATQQSSLRTQ